jgi:BatD DUF11 like domain
METPMRCRILVVAFASIVLGQFARADSPSVTAVLSNSEAMVGDTVELQIRVAGPGDVQAPDEIAVTGLEIYRTGENASSQIKFGAGGMQVTRTVTYTYTVLPKNAGTFTIPPQTIRVGNNMVRTPELTLNVADTPSRPSAARPGGRSTQSQAASTGDLAFAELIVPKKTAYVGEIVPAQIRVGYDPRTYPRPLGDPEIAGQGFTAQKLQQPEQHQETIGGRPYVIVSYKTAISAARAGKLELGPVKAKAQIVVPRARPAPRSRIRSPFDIDMNDPFSDPFFNNPFAQMGERREIEIKSDPITLDVKSLPPNAPPSFSGAIGNFTMNSDAKPKSVQVGDPITVTTAISGRGNFDRVNAPVVEDDRGWHKYPPSSKFKQDDEVGLSGTKTFETVLSPNENKQALPVLAFSYFDPAKEHYVTLRSEPIAITVQGGAPPTQNVASAPSVAPSVAPAAAPQRTEKPQDILYQLTERQGRTESFAPLYTRPVFWTTQLAPLVALLGFVGWKVRQRRIDDRDALRVAALQHEAAELMHKLRRNAAAPGEYYAEASRFVRLKTALASRGRGMDPNNVDAETAADTFKLNSDSRDQLRRLFEQSDEWQYSGAHNGPASVSPENRREVLQLIENLK